MKILAILFILQLIVAAIVILVLKALLERELFMSTLEGLHSIKDFKAGEKVMVISAVPLDPGRRDMLSKMLRQHLVVSGEPDFLVNSSLGGGILIQAGEEILDRTVFSRFKQMWGDAA